MIDTTLKAKLEAKARWVRQKVLEVAIQAKSGHITTAFSQTEVICALYYGGLLRVRHDEPRWPERDRFVLSKGQGGLGLYPVLADLGFFDMWHMDHFAARGSILGVHAEWNTPGIDIVSGSLGHGLPIASGIAYALLERGSDALVVTMTGDGELYEGSNWEALLSIAEFGLTNLVTVVDRNGMATIGRTDPKYDRRRCDGPALNPLHDKFEAFGFDVRDCDGHDYDSIFATLSDMRLPRKRPLCVISNTVKGKGGAVFEDARMCHYRVPGGADAKAMRVALGLDPATGIPQDRGGY